MIKNKERIRIARLRKMLAFSLVCLFFSLYWVRMKYMDEEFADFQIESYHQEIINLETENKRLQFLVDSISKSKVTNIEKTKSKILINTKQVVKTTDTTLPKIIEEPTDNTEEPTDTLNR